MQEDIDILFIYINLFLIFGYDYDNYNECLITKKPPSCYLAHKALHVSYRLP